jgi:Holliday junction resolvase RusA-like endonuclease
MAGRELFEGPVSVRLVVYVQAPASVSKKRYAAMVANELLPIIKPDLDNVLKIVADALNGIIYVDDKQIAQATLMRKYAKAPELEVEVAEILI